MRKFWGFLIIGILLLMAVCVSAADTLPGLPEAFLPESLYAFAPVVEGTTVAHGFVLQNRGEAPLKILRVRSG